MYEVPTVNLLALTVEQARLGLDLCETSIIVRGADSNNKLVIYLTKL